jgi:ATP-dependent helicase HrpB
MASAVSRGGAPRGAREDAPPWHGLPIAEAVPQLRAALEAAPLAILEAPPGAGKSTTLPLALLDAPWRGKGRILLLEPRRIAARAVATRLAAWLGEGLGGRVGLRTREETRVGPHTELEVVTEGVLTRLLQGDPELPGIAALLFDEFHERSLQADLGLALALEVQATLRPELRILVMSATLEGLPLTSLMPAATVIRSAGRSHPVTVHHADTTPLRLEDAPLLPTVREALAASPGDVLVFLPGARDIRRLQERLEASSPAGVAVMPLYGEMPAAEQDRVLSPAAAGERRIVLATSIAQTSLTLPGITAVVDAGWTRRPRYDPATDLSGLATVRISRATAEQRAGRAGRLGPGQCWRLWNRATHVALSEHDSAEILETELAGLALELAAWGATDASALRWLDAPPAEALARARGLLTDLGALRGDGSLTAHGRAIHRLGVHPRLGHMLLCARSADAAMLPLACRIAALAEERDPLRDSADARLEARLALLEARGSGGGARRLAQQAERLLRRLERFPVDASLPRPASSGALVALAWPERLAQARGGGGRFRLASGRGARLPEGDALGVEPWLAVARLRDEAREAVIQLAAPLVLAEIEGLFADRIEQQAVSGWDAREEAVVARRERRLGQLVLEQRPSPHPDPDALLEGMLEGVRSLGLEALPWSTAAIGLRERLLFATQHDPDGNWPAVDDAGLLATLPQWLGPWLTGCTRRAHLARLDLHEAIVALLDWSQRQRLDAFVPTHLTVPSGSRIRVDYADPAQPRLDVRLQECFGLAASPRLADGRVAVLMSLLSPAGRPVQLTRDLASFWASGYAEVKRELKGRYPKHFWPDDPTTAPATARVRPRPG